MPHGNPARARERPVPGQASIFEGIARQVFDDWRTIMGYPDARWTLPRGRVIDRILAAGYTPQDCVRVFLHAASIPWRRGESASGLPHDGLGDLLGDLETFEGLLREARAGHKPADTERGFRRGKDELLPSDEPKRGRRL